MKSPELKSAQNMGETMPTIYRKFKLSCIKNGLTVRRGLREAMHIWLEKEVNKNELSRYKACQEDIKKLSEGVRFIKLRCDEADDDNYVEKFQEIYDKIEEIFTEL